MKMPIMKKCPWGFSSMTISSKSDLTNMSRPTSSEKTTTQWYQHSSKNDFHGMHASFSLNRASQYTVENVTDGFQIRIR